MLVPFRRIWLCAALICIGSTTLHGDEPQAAAIGEEKLFKISIHLIEHAATDPDQAPVVPQVVEAAGEEVAAWLKSVSRNWSKFTMLASPTIVTVDGRPAQLRVGGERTFVVGYEGAQPKKETVSIGTNLTVLPASAADGAVRLSIDLEVADLRSVRTKWVRVAGQRRLQRVETPTVSQRKIQTTVELEEGQSMIVGRGGDRDARGEFSKVLFVTLERFVQPAETTPQR